MSDQADKYNLSLAGEFFVAAELQRRGIAAAVTYGNAKAADVVAFSPDRQHAVVVEVKSTAQDKWVVGGAVPPATNQLWVFVHIPKDGSLGPSYFVILQSELHEILAPEDSAYRAQYRARHGADFTGKGVVSLSRSAILQYQNAWGRIQSAIGAPNMRMDLTGRAR